jgi:hypothetical protein
MTEEERDWLIIYILSGLLIIVIMLIMPGG